MHLPRAGTSVARRANPWRITIVESALGKSGRRAALAAAGVLMVLFASCQRDVFVQPPVTPPPAAFFADPAGLAPGAIATYAGDGTIGLTGGVRRDRMSFYYPLALTVRPSDGELLIADYNNHRVCQVEPRTGIVLSLHEYRSDIFGGFTGTAPAPPQLRGPSGLAFDADGHLLLADFSGHSIVVHADAATDLWRRCGAGRGDTLDVPATHGRLLAPADLAWGPDSTLYISDQAAFAIDRIPPDSLVRDPRTGAVTTVLVWALAVETLVRGIIPANVSRLLPFTAAHGILGTRSAADTPETLAAALSSLGNAAVIGGWAMVTVAGTVKNDGFPLTSETTSPPAGAAWLRSTYTREVSPIPTPGMPAKCSRYLTGPCSFTPWKW